MLDRVAFLADRELRGVGLRVDRKARGRAGLEIIHEEFGEDLALPCAETAGEHMEASLLQFRTDELGVIDVETPEGEPIAGAPPDGVIVVEAAPEAFVLLAVAEVAEEGVHILQADALRVDLDHRDPGATVAANQSVESRLIMTDQFLLTEGKRRGRTLHRRREAGGSLSAALRLADEITGRDWTGLALPRGDSSLGIDRDSLRRIQIDQEAGRRDIAGQAGGSTERSNEAEDHGEDCIEN